MKNSRIKARLAAWAWAVSAPLDPAAAPDETLRTRHRLATLAYRAHCRSRRGPSWSQENERAELHVELTRRGLAAQRPAVGLGVTIAPATAKWPRHQGDPDGH